MSSDPTVLPIGYSLHGYRIDSVLGRGGFGITYRVVDTRRNCYFALKELMPSEMVARVGGSGVVPLGAAKQEEWNWARQRFVEEADMLSSFRHPAIVRVHEVFEKHGTVYMLMDYVDGDSYDGYLKKIGRETDQEAVLRVLIPLLNGVEEVHAKGLIHRDIKPENILIDPKGNPILIDFGSARSHLGGGGGMTSIVTHGYSPIEQYQSEGNAGPWTDIYALGAVAYRAIRGERPLVSTERVLEDRYDRLEGKRLAGFHPSFLREIDRALALHPKGRPQSVREWKILGGQRGGQGVAVQVAVAREKTGGEGLAGSAVWSMILFEEEVVSMLRAGKLSPRDYVLTEGMVEWSQLGEVFHC